MNTPLRLCLLAALAVVLAPLAAAEDWPQYLGPRRDATSRDAINTDWRAAGPTVLWRHDVGAGFAGPAVADGGVIIFHRVGDNDIIERLDAATGKRIWKHQYTTDYRDDFGFDNGPRAVPTIVGGRVYTYGAQGVLHCLDFATGKVVWKVDTHERYRSDKGFFGRVCSPLVDGDLVMLNIGGRDGKGIIALNKDTGDLVWSATDHEAGYASPTMATFDGRRLALFFTREGFVAIDPPTGRIVFQKRWRARYRASVNAATPLVAGDKVFLSASYEVGALVLEHADGTFREVWSSDDAISNHYATSVIHDGKVYGFHGRQEAKPTLRCIDLASGKVEWETPRTPAGTILLTGDTLLIMLETGELIAAPATPAGFNGIARADILAPTVRAYPALANGRLYVRNGDELVCFDLRPR